MSRPVLKIWLFIAVFIASYSGVIEAAAVDISETRTLTTTPPGVTEPTVVKASPIVTDQTTTTTADKAQAESTTEPFAAGESAFPAIPFPEYISEGAFFTWLDRNKNYVTSRIELMARSMDDYLSETTDPYDSSGSYLRIRQNFIIRERGKTETPTQVSFKLRLPNTEKKLKLFFETPQSRNPYDASSSTKDTPPATTSENKNYAIGVQGESGERFGWKYKPTIGADIDSGVDPFLRFRFTKDIQFVKWDINWQETPYWYNSLGWGFDSYFEINKRISEQDLFRSATFAGWIYDTDNFDLSHVFSMFHTLDAKKHLSYYAGVYGVSKPVLYTTEFLLGLTYRQDLHKHYLFFEVEPQIRYQEINRFHPEHSLTFRLELLFKK